MGKRLYISDLDGTLLNRQGELSEYSVAAINFLYKAGVDISFATARSYPSVKKLLKGLAYTLPIITFNGGHIVDPIKDTYMVTEAIESGLAQTIYGRLQGKTGLLVSCFQGGKDQLTYDHVTNQGQRDYLAYRQSHMGLESHVFDGFDHKDIMGFTLIDEKEKLLAIQKDLADLEGIHIELWADMYFQPWYWLSIHSCKATKGQALLTLRGLLANAYDQVVVFGDQINDLDMFDQADLAFATENGLDRLKARADEVIGNNHEDGVVKKILEMEGFINVTL